MVRWSLLAFFFCALLVLGGCDSSKPKTTKVSGTVELDGQPLDDGTITLHGEAGSVPDVLPVKNGKFEGEAKLGKKKVSIAAFKQGPKAMMDKEEVKDSGKQDYLAARYGVESTTLTAEVTSSGMNPSTFKVESK